MTDDIEIRRRRAAYRACHRGTKEMDVVLGRFAQARLAAMAGTPTRAAVAAAELCETGPKPGKHYDHQAIETRIRELLAERRRQSGEE